MLTQYVSDLMIPLFEDVIKTHTHTHTIIKMKTSKSPFMEIFHAKFESLKAEVIEGPVATLTHFPMNHQHLLAKLHDVDMSKSKKTSSLLHIITVFYNKHYTH